MKLNGHISYLLYAASIAAAAPVAKRAGTSYSGGNTANDVTNGVCAPLTLIFARGSTESGNMGSSVGPALAKKLIADLGNDGVAIQGVEYPATIESNISMGSEGGPAMAKLAQQALQNCPNTKIALSGYSQGATVTHYAVKSGGLSADDVSSAVLYGDPEKSQSVGGLSSSKVKEFCAAGDGVCETGTFSISAAHLSYTTGSDIPDGAAFIEQNAGTSSSSSSGTSTSSGSDSSESSTASSSGLGGLGSLTGSGSSGSSSLGSLGSFGSLTGSSSSGSSGLGSLGGTSTSSGFGSLPSLGSTSGTSSGLGSLSSLSGSSGSSGLSGLSGLFKRLF